MKATLTMNQVIKVRQAHQAEQEFAGLQRDLKKEQLEKLLNKHPHIGVLNGGNRGYKFYSCVTGNYVESYIIEELI